MNTVIIIDDDKTTLDILESQLSSFGYNIIIEKHPARGVELAKEFSPEVILLDLNMPDMNGFEVMKILRKDKLTKEIPVVILTVNKDKETVVDAMRSGAIDYVVKPYNLDKLNMKIKSAITHGINRKQRNIEALIEIAHKGESALIILRGGIRDDEFRNAFKTMFTPFFMKTIQGRICIFDIKEMKDFNDDDVKEFMKVLSLFSASKIKVVTGKQYGQIVSSFDIDDNVELFLSFGDLDVAMNLK